MITIHLLSTPYSIQYSSRRHLYWFPAYAVVPLRSAASLVHSFLADATEVALLTIFGRLDGFSPSLLV